MPRIKGIKDSKKIVMEAYGFIGGLMSCIAYVDYPQYYRFDYEKRFALKRKMLISKSTKKEADTFECATIGEYKCPEIRYEKLKESFHGGLCRN